MAQEFERWSLPTFASTFYFMSQPSFIWTHCFIIINVAFEILLCFVVREKKIAIKKVFSFMKELGFQCVKASKKSS
jgi:hypothetical protein